jgi:hypothetical protein
MTEVLPLPVLPLPVLPLPVLSLPVMPLHVMLLHLITLPVMPSHFMPLPGIALLTAPLHSISQLPAPFLAFAMASSSAASTLLSVAVGTAQDGWRHALWLLEPLAAVDPAPLFVLSLLPYLAFLRWAGRSGRFPPLALRGFQFTLVFVAVTIVAAVVAELRFGQQLADVDPLHGAAESFLTVANLMVLLGFSAAAAEAPPPQSHEQVLRPGEDGVVHPEDGASVSDPR